MKKGHLGFGLVKGVDKILPICGWASIAINFCFFLRLDEEWYHFMRNLRLADLLRDYLVEEQTTHFIF